MESTEPSAYQKLEPRQQRFVDAYCATLNASEAARIAGYKGSYASIGSQNLIKLNIQEAIKERLRYFGMGPDEVRSRLDLLTKSDMSDFLTVTKKNKAWVAKLDLKKAQERGRFVHIKKIKIKDGEVESMELHDPLRALSLLAQIHGIIDPKEEHGSNPDNDIELDWEDAPGSKDPTP